MKPASLIGHTVELFQEIDSHAGTSTPADRIASDFSRKRSYLGSHDRRFISETVYGMIRHRRLIEALLERFLDEAPAFNKLNAQPQRILPLYEAFRSASEVFHLVDGLELPQVPPEKWREFFPDLDQQAYCRWLLGHRDLAFLPNDQNIKLGVRYSFQDWMVEKWDGELGTEAEPLLSCLNTPSPITLRVNTMKATREECHGRLKKEGIETELTKFSPFGLTAKKRFNIQTSAAFQEGWFEVQDEGSQLIAMACSPQSGVKIIDSCAGAGGKTLQLASSMKDAGEIVAMDTEPARLQELSRRAERAGFRCITTIPTRDASPESLSQSGDCVLVDAPCTGTGTIRRSPWLKWSITESIVEEYAARQQEILSSNAQYVRLGGRLVYATCSLFRAENSDVVQSFLSSHPDFSLIPINLVLGPLGINGDHGTLTLYPHRYGTDGFFVAVMKKEG